MLHPETRKTAGIEARTVFDEIQSERKSEVNIPKHDDECNCLPAEWLAELEDFLALADDELEGKRPTSRNIAQARSYLRHAACRVERLIGGAA
ncbi:hypothetical protein SAMN05444398_103268 [Roseovarius pacificus]|uniref:Uncharacterized protein n=1 Tax=Roseovarius pacificus TaxID=337701 RepID=A0A1M7BJ38_9RHOB|nr:hypothetical protein [Roseovarius pacificus]GGO55186.1 hypothetical protein GCM10011315_17130 [Roseovarius pacificus]SHL55055.1 hypothetical protein SAMN05444398_103268 [Roseovarius pacificus]